MTPKELIESALVAGVALDSNGVTIYAAPPEKVTPHLAQAIRENKPALICALLETRLKKGSAILWQMERRGRINTEEYDTTFRHWTNIRCAYEKAWEAVA